MLTNRQFAFALEALPELKTDEAPLQPQPMPFDQTQDKPATPDLGRVLAEIGPLPREALFLGVASDGLPVLLNLRDPIPGPLLITGDAGTGKTGFLQSVARSIPMTHAPGNVQYGVITNHPEEWEGVETTPHRIGLFSTHQTGAQDLLFSLASWAHSNKNQKQSILLLIDDLESVASLDFDALQNLRWLLLRGPARRVWPVITLNAARYGHVLSWIPGFRTRIFCRMEDNRIAAALGADASSGVETLEKRIQFSLRENGGWLRFWLPSC